MTAVNNYNFNVAIPTPPAGANKLNDAQREELRDVTTNKIVDKLQDPAIPKELREQLVGELRDRLKNDPDMNPDLKKELEALVTKAEKGPVTEGEADRMRSGIDKFNDAELKEDGLTPYKDDLKSPEELKKLPTSELIEASLLDMSKSDRKELGAELRSRTGNLTGQDKTDAEALIKKIEDGGKLSFAEMDKLQGLMKKGDGKPDDNPDDE